MEIVSCNCVASIMFDVLRQHGNRSGKISANNFVQILNMNYPTDGEMGRFFNWFPTVRDPQGVQLPDGFSINPVQLTQLIQLWVTRQGSFATVGRLTAVLLQNPATKAMAEAVSQLGQPQTRIVSSMAEVDSIRSVTSNVLNFGVMQPIQSFVGRTSELQDLNKIFQDKSRSSVLILVAMGGQGKTELVKKFIQEIHEDCSLESSPHIVGTWLKAQTSSQLTSSILEFVTMVGASADDPATGQPLPLLKLVKIMAEKVIERVPPPSRWVVVLDNVDDKYSELEQVIQLMQQSRVNQFLIITTRNNSIFSGSAPQYDLQPLTTTDSELLVKNILGNPDEEETKTLCAKLGNHALALQQAASYIREKQRTSLDGKFYSVAKYICALENKPSLLRHPVKLMAYNHTIYDIVKTTMTTIQGSFGEIGERAPALAILLGVIHPDGINVNILHKLIPNPCNQTISLPTHGPGSSQAVTKNDWTLETTRDVVELLAKFSIVKLEGYSIFSVNRIVQHIFRSDPNFRQSFCGILHHVSALIKDATSEEFSQITKIWSHAALEHVKNYPKFAQNVFNKMRSLSHMLQLTGFAEQNHKSLSTALGPDHIYTLRMEDCMGIAAMETGHYEDALNKFRQVLKKKKRVLGERHASTVGTMSRIAHSLSYLQQFSEALHWNQTLLNLDLQIFGNTHNRTMTTKHIVAICLGDLKEYERALVLCKEILEWRTTNNGPNDKDTLKIRQNIACILYEMGRSNATLNQALQEFRAVLEGQIQLYGMSHVETLRTKIWVAKTLWELRGRSGKEEAKQTLQEVIQTQENVIGVNHRETQAAKNLLSEWEEGTSE